MSSSHPCTNQTCGASELEGDLCAQGGMEVHLGPFFKGTKEKKDGMQCLKACA